MFAGILDELGVDCTVDEEADLEKCGDQIKVGNTFKLTN